MEKLGEPVLLWLDLPGSWVIMICITACVWLALGFDYRVLDTCVILKDIIIWQSSQRYGTI